MRTGVTLVDITRAADQLLADGERPTVDGIRKFLGTGSPATVNALLKEYYQSLPARLNLPAPIATAAAELYEKVRSTALEEVAEQRAELERQVSAEREQIAQDRRTFEFEKTELKAHVSSLASQVEQLQGQLRQTNSKASQLEKDLSEQSERAAAAEAQVRAGEDERERANQRHSSEIQRLREQSEGNERHLLARIEEQKTQTQRVQADREKDAAAAAKRISELDVAVSEALKQQASLRAEIATAQREAMKRGEALAVSESALVRAQEDAAKVSTGHRETSERQRAQLEQVEKSVEQLKRERDDAIREAARVEGKLVVMKGQLDEVRAELKRLQKQGST